MVFPIQFNNEALKRNLLQGHSSHSGSGNDTKTTREKVIQQMNDQGIQISVSKLRRTLGFKGTDQREIILGRYSLILCVLSFLFNVGTEISIP